MEIFVVRGSGDKQGDDIIEALLATEPAAVSRGRAELDANAHNSQSVTLVIKYTSGIKLGQLVRVYDDLLGESWVAKVVSINHSIKGFSEGGPSISTTLSLERPTEFYQ